MFPFTRRPLGLNFRTIPFRLLAVVGLFLSVICICQSAVGADMIVDNGDEGTSSTGNWSVASGANPIGADACYSNLHGATYTFTFNVTPGEYSVYSWWTIGQVSRRNKVPYDIQHVGGTTRVTVNQKFNGRQWNMLGTWNFGTVATVTIRSLGNGYTCADAVKLIPTGGNAAAVIFSDSFSDGPGWYSRWIQDPEDQASWGVEGGGLVQQALAENFVESYHTGTYVFLEDPDISGISAYRFSVDITPLPNEIEDQEDQKEGNDVGIMFRYADEYNYYRVSMSARYGFTRFEKVSDGIFKTLAVNAIGYVDDQPMTFTVEDNGDTIIVLIDGDPVFTTREPAGTARVALYCQDRARFDNVLITEPTGEPMVVISSPLAYSIASTPDEGDFINAEAVVLNKPPGGSVFFTLDDGPETLAMQGGIFCFAYFHGVADGEHEVAAIVRDANGNEVADDVNSTVGTGGDYIVTVGDSITNGVGDYIPSNNDSIDGRIVSIQGYQAELADKLTITKGRPQIVFNEGIRGDKISDLNARIESIMERHPGANKVLLMIGTNNCRSSVEHDDYKAMIATIINAVNGKRVWLARPLKVVQDTESDTWVDSCNLRLGEYGQALKDLANTDPDDNTFIGPNFYKVFSDLGNPLTYYADRYHPTDAGYQVMADEWHHVLSALAPPTNLRIIVE